MDSMENADLQSNMHQLIFEVLVNSLEEARLGYCTKIDVELLADNKVKITDNGRGMPLSGDLKASKAVLDKILTGRPITNAEYSQMGDLTQAGLQTVNSLCELLQITVIRDGKQYRQDYIRGIAQHDLSVSRAAEKHTIGTEIVFKPDRAIFGNTEFSKAAVCSWIGEKAAGIDELDINVHGQEIGAVC